MQNVKDGCEVVDVDSIIGICYQPEMMTVKKDLIYASIASVKSGIKHAKENLSKYDKTLEELTYKDETWVKKIEEDIRQMESTLNLLREQKGEHYV